MAIFSNGGASKATKRTTPRGSGNLFLATTTTPHRSESNRSTGYPPEKTGDTISPSHVTTNINLAPMENNNTPGHNRPPTGKSPPTLLEQKPESMVAETLRMKGELEFTRLLRVDGRFEGELITDKGSLVVGPKGEVVGDLKNMQQEVYVEGIVRGNVFANDVKIKNAGMLLGDVQCMCLTLDPTASIRGVTDTLTVNPSATARAAKYFAPAATAAGPSSRKSIPPTLPPSYSSSVAAAAARAQVDESSKSLNSAPSPSPPVTLKLPPAAAAAGHHQGVTDTATLKERALLEANPAPPSASSSTTGAAPAPAPVPSAVAVATTTPANGGASAPTAEDAVVAAEGGTQTGKVPEAASVEEAAPGPSPSS
ncbi:unnamed protein product [Ectocarpus sp. 4 AP-2014]